MSEKLINKDAVVSVVRETFDDLFKQKSEEFPVVLTASATIISGIGLGILFTKYLPDDVPNKLASSWFVRFILLFLLVWQGGGKTKFLPSLLITILFYVIIEAIIFYRNRSLNKKKKLQEGYNSQEEFIPKLKID